MLYRSIQRRIGRGRGSSASRILQPAPSATSCVATATVVSFSSWQGHGTDLLGDSLAHNYGVPKLILKGHSASGFDIVNMVKNMDLSDDALRKSGGVVHCTGSLLVFPDACYLWSVRSQSELTVESLAATLLYRPSLEYLFIGSAQPISPQLTQTIREGLNAQRQALSPISSTSARSNNLVVEPMDLTNAMGTFNILNGEDRRVAAAMILPRDDDEDEQ